MNNKTLTIVRNIARESQRSIYLGDSEYVIIDGVKFVRMLNEEIRRRELGIKDSYLNDH